MRQEGDGEDGAKWRRWASASAGTDTTRGGWRRWWRGTAPALLRVANQFSLCHDDALDAYQRALEIYLRRLDTVDPATEGAWLRVVVKHEAMAIRRARLESVDRDDVDLDASVHAGAARGRGRRSPAASAWTARSRRCGRSSPTRRARCC